MGFQSRFECREGGSIPDVFRKCVPEGRGCHGECPVTPGPTPGLLGDLEEAGVTGSEGTGWDMWPEEVREVGGGQVVKSFVGGKEHFEVDSLSNWEPVEVSGGLEPREAPPSELKRASRQAERCEGRQSRLSAVRVASRYGQNRKYS